MEIYALKGYKVKVTEDTKNNGNSWDKEKIKEYLTLEKTYTVKYTHVHSYSTDVYLQEIPEVKFNSVNFVGITKQPKELNAQHEDYHIYN